MSRVIPPGSTIGVLGSGQLGRMMAIEARRLGYRVHVYSPEKNTPTGQVADLEVQARYDDLDAVSEFARGVDVLTFEFENVLSETINAVDQYTPVYPAGRVLHTTQQRLREKTFLTSAGIPVTPFAAIRTKEDLEAISQDLVPGVLKTTAWGYDGKGQVKVESMDDLPDAWAQLDCQEAVLEKFVSFEAELSVVAVRGQDSAVELYGPIANSHANHILDVSVSPGGFSEKINQEAFEIARTILTELDVIGVLCVEFFLTTDGQLLVNELAPRPHNSGHLTIEGHTVCQFEQQVRAVCGLPLGSAQQIKPAAMVNLLGDVWEQGEPNWPAVLKMDGLKLHLYGKKEARPGRKMGHMTILADSGQDAVEKAVMARKLLNPSL